MPGPTRGSNSGETDRRGFVTVLLGSLIVGAVGTLVAELTDRDPGGTGGAPVSIDSIAADEKFANPTGFNESKQYINYGDSDVSVDKGQDPSAFNLYLQCQCRGQGQFDMVGTGAVRTEWRATEGGSYQLEIDYDANGGYDYTDPGDGAVIASLGSTLSVRNTNQQGKEKGITTAVRQDTGSTEPGAFERALQEAARAAFGIVVSKRLGPLAGALSQQLLSLLESFVNFNVDKGDENTIPVDIQDKSPLSLKFDAKKGEKLTFEYVATAVLRGNVDTDEEFDGSVDATYRPQKFRVRRIN